jgi:hypothetical protein
MRINLTIFIKCITGSREKRKHMTSMGFIALNTDGRYHYEKQVENVIRGSLFISRLFPDWCLYVDISLLGTFIPGTSIYDQLNRYIVFPEFSLEERINLGFLALPEFLLTNTLEAIWATVIYGIRKQIENKKHTDSLPAVIIVSIEEEL